MSDDCKYHDLIPPGIYCYCGDYVCPYWYLDPGRAPQENGFCSFMEIGDWERADSISLLWDQVKECGINMGEE